MDQPSKMVLFRNVMKPLHVVSNSVQTTIYSRPAAVQATSLSQSYPGLLIIWLRSLNIIIKNYVIWMEKPSILLQFSKRKTTWNLQNSMLYHDQCLQAGKSGGLCLGNRNPRKKFGEYYHWFHVFKLLWTNMFVKKYKSLQILYLCRKRTFVYILQQ